MFIISFFTKYIFIFTFCISSFVLAESFDAIPSGQASDLFLEKIKSFYSRNECKEQIRNDHITLLALFLVRSNNKIFALCAMGYIVSSLEAQDKNESSSKRFSEMSTRIGEYGNRFLEYYKEEISGLEQYITKEKLE
jgi:hypothetical protein